MICAHCGARTEDPSVHHCGLPDPGVSELRARLEAILRAAAVEVRPCRACGVMLAFVVHRDTGKTAPYTLDGINHFTNCPEADRFKRRKPARQSALFDTAPRPR